MSRRVIHCIFPLEHKLGLAQSLPVGRASPWAGEPFGACPPAWPGGKPLGACLAC